MKDDKKKPRKRLTLERHRLRTLSNRELANAAGGRHTDSCLSKPSDQGTLATTTGCAG